jgi:hypothetical protein
MYGRHHRNLFAPRYVTVIVARNRRPMISGRCEQKIVPAVGFSGMGAASIVPDNTYDQKTKYLDCGNSCPSPEKDTNWKSLASGSTQSSEFSAIAADKE